MPEVALDNRHHLIGIEITDQRDNHVAGQVVLVEKVLCVGSRERLQVRRIADGGAMIGIGVESCAQKLLDKAPGGSAVGTHAPLFHDDVALFVEVTHYGISEAVGLDRRPKLNHVGGHRVHVAGFVVGGKGVHADSAMALDDFAKLVLDDKLVGGGDSVLPFLLELGKLLGIASDTFDTLSLVSGIGLFDLCERDLFFGVVGGADVGRALEGHVLHHVSQAGLRQRVLGGASVNHGEE